MASDNLRRGALHMIASALLFAGMSSLIKIVAVDLPNEMVVFFRCAMGLAVLLPWVWHRGFHNLRTNHLSAHLVRGLAGLAAMYCFFFAIAHMTLAEATLLNYSTPLFIPLFAWLALGEKAPGRLWWAIGTGLVGIALILKPGLALFTPVALIGVAAGVFAAVAMTGIRRLSRTEPTTRIVFYFTALSTAVSAIPLAWSWQTPGPRLWALLIVIGLLGSVAQLLLTRAYASAPAAQVGPFTYATVVFAALAGWIFWAEVPDGLSLAGAVLVALGGILTIRLAGRRAPPLAEIPAARR